MPQAEELADLSFEMDAAAGDFLQVHGRPRGKCGEPIATTGAACGRTSLEQSVDVCG
jgi:hypothetical protein